MSEAESKKIPVCLTIAGLDPSGGAGVIADIKSFFALGCYGAAVVTSVTFQNTQGVFGAIHQTGDSVSRQALPVIDDFDIAAVKTGMLPTAEVIDAVASIVRGNKIRNLVVDPVVRSTSGFDLIDDEALKRLVGELFPLSAVVTPNLQEAERISGIKIGGEDELKAAAKIMLDMGAKNVLIKGGHFLNVGAAEQKKAVDRLFDSNGSTDFAADFIETNSTHGTGCTLSAAIAAYLAHGLTLNEAVSGAKAYITEAIRTSQGLGKGHSPVNHWAGVKI